jgi:hypothetical protein
MIITFIPKIIRIFSQIITIDLKIKNNYHKIKYEVIKIFLSFEKKKGPEVLLKVDNMRHPLVILYKL